MSDAKTDFAGLLPLLLSMALNTLSNVPCHCFAAGLHSTSTRPHNNLTIHPLPQHPLPGLTTTSLVTNSLNNLICNPATPQSHCHPATPQPYFSSFTCQQLH
ncbi:hypothetical protein C0Q70_18843 [Pomacea canaliculata]|uniref:Uncharacterized protein n=1 Tax=Pomacea canaliculata TaxID=400727 RepID=A0A2T7NHQ4_POMCA|nr:hypothetical protein C0Q70_18843 [Pomacea canaliculata]